MVDVWTEKKIKPRLWKFKYVETLFRKPKKKRGKIKAVQTATKTTKDRYKLKMTGRRY